jgi:glycosyltransferase involved in cell wall biosynthesis
VLPSQPTEGLPTVILEAFACGTPVYATPVSGIPDIIQDNETGHRISEIDPAQISKNIEQILDREEERYVSKNAYELIEAEYTFDAAVARYRSIIKDMQKN